MRKICVNCIFAFIDEDPMYHDTQLCCGRFREDEEDDLNYEYVDDEDTCEEFTERSEK